MVIVSFDEDYKDWKQSLKDNEVLGIHVADLKGSRAPTTSDYGVNRLPAEFRSDSDGEILDRDELMGNYFFGCLPTAEPR